MHVSPRTRHVDDEVGVPSGRVADTGGLDGLGRLLEPSGKH